MKFRMDSLHYALLAVVVLLAVYVLRPLKKEGKRNYPKWCIDNLNLSQQQEYVACKGYPGVTTDVD